MRETKVKCPQCGAEFDVLAEHQHMATGMVIGKDSEMGTILLPLLKKGEYKDAGHDIYIESETFNKVMNNVNKEELPMELQESIKLMQNMSVNDKLAAIFKALDISKDDIMAYVAPSNSPKGEGVTDVCRPALSPLGESEGVSDEIEQTIRQQGAVRDIRLFRRRIVAMVLNWEFGENWVRDCDENGKFMGNHKEVLGFHKKLKNKGYMYQWESIVGKSSHEKYCELADQERLYRHNDMECYEERNTYINKELVANMAWDFINRVLPKWIETLPEYENRRYGKYIKLRGYGKGVCVKDLQHNVYAPLRDMAMAIEQSQTPRELLNTTKDFVAKISAMKLSRDFKTSIGQYRPWMEAFKATGAFHVMKSLCYQGMWLTVDGEKLNEMRAHQHLRGAYLTRKPDGYKMLGMMREFLRQNGFDYKKQCEEWKANY